MGWVEQEDEVEVGETEEGDELEMEEEKMKQ
jgi:hypothetical protein